MSVIRLLTISAAICACLAPTSVIAQTAPKEHKVAAATRLDWEFAARGFGAGPKLPTGYESAKQRYQIFVPKNYRKDKAWPLVLFISASDQPAGWKNWQKVCEQEGVLFASPFGAGNTEQIARRTRVILDVLDDVRHNYRIDPDQTYLTGFSGGGRMACSIAFALPEYFGGVIPVCGTNPLSGPNYLRHRVEERLSVAFVTGEKDMNRKENEIYMTPWFEDLGIRTKLWVVPKMGHDVPSSSVMSEIYTWLTADIDRRRDEAKAHPKLAVKPEEAPTGPEQAKRLLEAGIDALKQPDRTWRGVNLLQGITQRWGKTASAEQARTVLKKLVEDDTLLQRVEDQGPRDEVKALSAQAKALERFGNIPKAIEAWELLAKNYAGTPIGAKADDNIRRLRK